MQYTNHAPLYYHERDNEKISRGFSWHIFDSNAYYRGCDVFPHQSLKQQLCLGYDKETMRNIIQSQDETLRHQVRELHRLYSRQRELINDVKIRGIYDLHLQPKSIFPGFDSGSNIIDLNEEKISLTSSITDLEPTSSAKTGDPPPFDLLRDKNSKPFIDLNEPFVQESLLSSSTENSCLVEIITHRDRHAGYEDAIDLNTVPCDDIPSDSETRQEGIFSSEDRIEDKNSNGISFTDTNTTDVDKETEEPTQEELDRAAAAEILMGIFSSARRIDRRLTPSGPLSWFADFIISSSLPSEERTEDENGTTKPSPEIVRRKSVTLSLAARDVNNHRNVRKRRGKLNVRKPESSSARKKRCVLLRDWGKIKKRGGFSRRSKYAELKFLRTR